MAAKKKTAATAAPAPAALTLPAQASMTRIPGAVFLASDYSDLASVLGLPPGRVAWLVNTETNTLTGFNPVKFQA